MVFKIKYPDNDFSTFMSRLEDILLEYYEYTSKEPDILYIKGPIYHVHEFPIREVVTTIATTMVLYDHSLEEGTVRVGHGN